MMNEALDSDAGNLAPDFLAKILSPYQGTNTAYLKSATVGHAALTEADGTDKPLFSVSGRFCIPNSCYIRDTGHFNAVEFLICYNQLAYSTFGYMFQAGVFRNGRATRLPPLCRELLATVSIERFFTQQLSSMLILKCTTRFRDVIDAKDFRGTFSVERLSYHKGSFFTETRCVFNDAAGGYAEGDVLLGYIANVRPESQAAVPRQQSVENHVGD